MKEVTVKREDDTLFALLNCEIDHHSAKAIRESIDDAMKTSGARKLVMDFSGVGFMDSSGIGLIIGRSETARRLGGSVAIRSLSPHMLRIVRMSGVEKIRNLTIEAEEDK